MASWRCPTSCSRGAPRLASRRISAHLGASRRISARPRRRVPGSPSERRTPSGELNWIFTAVTDAIAWATLPRDLFRRLFRQDSSSLPLPQLQLVQRAHSSRVHRQDMLLASLCRNFLLAQRVFARYDLHPTSSPPLPEAHGQPPRDTCRGRVTDVSWMCSRRTVTRCGAPGTSPPRPNSPGGP